MSLTCSINCKVVSVQNTGTTDVDLIFVDCSGQTISMTVLSGDTAAINYCDINPFSGNTLENLSFSKPRRPTYAYYFSSCCETNEVFTFFSTEFNISYDDSVYAKEYIESATGQPLSLQCTYLYNKISVKSNPPIYGYLVSALNGFERLEEFGCEQCIGQHPCLKQCYGLLSCDGGYQIITSTNQNLSGYVDTFVYIDISLPVPETPTTPFLVKDLGVIDCSREYEITIVSSAETCDCTCYSFRSPENFIDVVYVDCDYNLITTNFQTGQTISFCSLVRPIFATRRPVGIKLGGKCINGNCPSPPPITIKPRNECDVLTIFPMEAECFVTHPSNPYSYDGEASLGITGGTPPYQIFWEIGSVSSAITNLNAGEYNATVTDYYGDFIINTTCVLTADTTTTTTSTTIKPLPTYGNLCLVLVKRSSSKLSPFETVQIQLDYNGYKNGYPEWLSSDNQYDLYWSTGDTNNWVITGYPSSYVTIVNNTTSIPPLNGWQALGSLEIYSISVLSGNCGTNSLVGFNVSVNPKKCENDGSIIIQAYGGTGVYQYSIDNGITFSSNPIFQNLAGGNYIVFVKDSNNVVATQTVFVPTQPAQSVTVLFSGSPNTDTFIITSDIQPGYTLSFDLNHVNNFSYFPDSLSPQPQFNNIVTINGFGPMTQIINTTTQTPLSLACSLTPVIQNNNHKEYRNTFTLTNNQVISGTFTNSVTNQPIGFCTGSNKNYQFFINNAKILNCKCCKISVKNPPVQITAQKI
jgi:hypothetical protein